jgi:hypothetical protein
MGCHALVGVFDLLEVIDTPGFSCAQCSDRDMEIAKIGSHFSKRARGGMEIQPCGDHVFADHNDIVTGCYMICEVAPTGRMKFSAAAQGSHAALAPRHDD